MIGKISIGKSFKGCIYYCFEDKKLTHSEAVPFKNRAEFLSGNFCYGSKEELVSQFNAVRALNKRVEKPVMHLTLSLAKGEQLERGKLIEMVHEVAKELNFEKNQYLAVAHHDTDYPHVHLVINRIGYDGKTLKDSNNYGKIATCCRNLELKYGLKQVLSPGRYLSKEQRQLPRQDIRKDTLRQRIKETLTTSKSFMEFERKMKVKGYQVLKGRGISFIDDKGVRIKGSEVGYPLRKLEQALEQKQELSQQPVIKLVQKEENIGQSIHIPNLIKEHHHNQGEKLQEGKMFEKAAAEIFKPELVQDETNSNWQQKKKKRKQWAIRR